MRRYADKPESRQPDHLAHDVVVRQTTPAAGVAPSVTLGATIVGVRDYYWRVQATAGSTPTPHSEIFAFNVGFGISITPPTVLAPVQGSLQPVRPTLSAV
jgi:hypothetical protein